MTLNFILNGRPTELEVSPDKRLLDLLREDLGLTGTKEGCGEGECGACTVIIDGEAMHSCLVLACQLEGKSVLTITEKGYGKRTPVEEYRVTNRGGLGIKNYQIPDKTGKIVSVKVVDGSEDLLLVTQSGILIRTPVESIKETASRATQGVIVMRFKEEGDRVISMALAEHEDTAEPVPEAPAEEVSPENSAPVENPGEEN